MKVKCPEKEWDHLHQGFLVELNVLVYGVDVLLKMIVVFCLLDDKDIIHIPKPLPKWMHG